MTTAEDLKALRRLVNEPEDVEPYTNASLTSRLDSGKTVQAVAGEIWREKAAAYAELTDVQEGSSRRALGDLHEQALAMADAVAPGSTTSDGRTRRAGTRPIVRP